MELKYKSEKDAVRSLEQRGFHSQFRAEGGGLRATSSEKLFRPEDLEILEIYRFEGSTDVEDMSVVYGIRGIDGTKGTLVDAYGPYSDPQIGNLLERISVRPPESSPQ